MRVADCLTYIAIQLGLKCRVPLARSLAKMVIFVQNLQVACDTKADEAIICCWGVIVEKKRNSTGKSASCAKCKCRCKVSAACDTKVDSATPHKTLPLHFPVGSHGKVGK